MGIISRLQSYVAPEPDLYAVPDKTGATWGMDHLIDMLDENTEAPEIGDVVAKLNSCGMGVSVRRDIRYRVVKHGPYPTSVTAIDGNGRRAILNRHYMRRSDEVRRFWYLFD